MDREQQLRVMLECANTHIANSVMFALSTRIPTMGTNTDIFAVLTGGVHSSGRFVFLHVKDTPKGAYEKAYKFAQSQLQGVALIGVTPESVQWDPCSMMLLQVSDTEIPSVKLYENACRKLAQECAESIDTSVYSREDLLDIIRLCRLHDDPLGQGDTALLEELRYQEGLPTVEQRVDRTMRGAEIYQAYIGFCDDETEGTKLVWRVMAHLLMRQRYVG